MTATDKALVAEIVRNDAELERLIREKAGLVEPAVLPYLARASAHFRMLQLAHSGSLGDDRSLVTRYRYPWQLDEVLATEVARLQRRRERLRRAPAVAQGPLEPLILAGHLELEAWPSPLRPVQRARQEGDQL